MQITATGVSTTGSPRLLEVVELEDGDWQITILGNKDKRHAVVIVSHEDTVDIANLVIKQDQGRTE